MVKYYEEVTVKNALACMALFMKDDEDLTCGDIQGLMEKMQPASNIVEVVWCKDCIHCDMVDENERWCLGWGSPARLVAPDSYCSRGIRKEGQR